MESGGRFGDGRKKKWMDERMNEMMDQMDGWRNGRKDKGGGMNGE